MEHYLLYVNTDVDFLEMIEKVNDDCTLEFDGSVIHKNVHLMVSSFFFTEIIKTTTLSILIEVVWR